jgi:uncharacterized damage-inducible protein DinB
MERGESGLFIWCAEFNLLIYLGRPGASILKEIQSTKINRMNKPVINTMAILLFTLVFSITGIPGQAQPITGDQIKAQFIKDWERAKAYTLEYLNAMPADKYGFKAVDSIRSFAQQMLHLAQGNVNLISNGTGQTRIFAGRNLEASEGARSRDSVVYYVSQSYYFCIQGVKDLDPAKYAETVGSGNFKQMRYTWILKAFEHQTHHRGQTTIYIRLLGIRPPGEKLF